MSNDHLTSLLNDRYGNLRITAPQPSPNVETSPYLVVDRKNPRLLYLSRNSLEIYNFFLNEKYFFLFITLKNEF